ncbi:hypothetical protein [Flavobacterium sp. SORGH_AS_0622]|uniref:hypothetical protein n=1 Tax=Flavobacterium sp. SORGH_AS_0622 TaxID=3041772 RepID=UPI0027874E67|nr:hypothetical protein [Flavobacterium sp. SORGH_AS_0622]MDQ1164358.1 hypothetical protein [Flavobacterium sp. SORGH_AS_0622]
MKLKIKLIIIISFLINLSCNRDKKESMENKIHPDDTSCMEELHLAKKDISNAKLVYCNYTGNIVYHPLRAQKQMDSLLHKFKVKFQNEGSPCVIENNRNYHCYCEYMEEKIVEKYGEKFIDSLLFKADSIYILKHLDETFYNGSLSGTWDKPALFPNDTHYDQTNHSGLQKVFERIVKYPKDYIYTKEANSLSYFQIYLDIDEKGKAKIIDHHFVFWNGKTKQENYNKKYWDYFKNIAFSLIEGTTWIPAKIKNINVKSRNNIIIYLK